MDLVNIRGRGSRGFSLYELLIVAALGIILVATGLPLVESALRQAKADGAMNVVMSKMRLARQLAVDQRRVHRVTIVEPSRVRLERREIDGSWTTLVEESLPDEFAFRLVPGLPGDEASTPDGMGASRAVDLKNSNQLLFRPEGSATDAAREPANGIVYLAKEGKLESARAVTVFGSTGRIKGWRYAQYEGSSWGWTE